MWKMVPPLTAVRWKGSARHLAWYSRTCHRDASPSSTDPTVTLTCPQNPCHETPVSPVTCEYHAKFNTLFYVNSMSLKADSYSTISVSLAEYIIYSGCIFNIIHVQSTLKTSPVLFGKWAIPRKNIASKTKPWS